MVAPLVFISSTSEFKKIREDLKLFIEGDFNYKAILNEKSDIAYSSDERLEESCYRDARRCDILIHLVGTRLGTVSNEPPYSISQKEVLTGIDARKQIYIFVREEILAEYEKYEKERDGFSPEHVDNIQIYDFLFEMKARGDIQIWEFEDSKRIKYLLFKQWIGLFQLFLEQRAKGNQITVQQAQQLENYELFLKILDPNKPILERLDELEKICTYGIPNPSTIDTINLLLYHVGELRGHFFSFKPNVKWLGSLSRDVIQKIITDNNTNEIITVLKYLKTIPSDYHTKDIPDIYFHFVKELIKAEYDLRDAGILESFDEPGDPRVIDLSTYTPE